MMDEIRHTQLQMSLRNYYVKHAKDPAGWDISQRALYQHPGGLVSVGEFQHFNTGDPVDCIVDLNVIIETAFTNILLVAVPQIGVANGDHALATTLLSIQSDESRHMANGYGSLMALLSDERNVPEITGRWSATSGTRTRRSTGSSVGRPNTARRNGPGRTRTSGRSGSSTISSAATSTG